MKVSSLSKNGIVGTDNGADLAYVYRGSFHDTGLYGSMLNCVNALEQQLPEPLPPAPADEKHDSSECLKA